MMLDRDGARERRHAVLQRFELLDGRGPDDVGPGRQELAELDVGRAEPPDRDREAARRRAAASRPRDEPGQRQRQPAPRPARPRGSTPEKTPSRASTKPARARRSDMAEGREHRAQSFQAEWIATTPPVSRVAVTRRKPASRDHVGEPSALGKAADRFDEVAVGLAVARHQPAHAPGSG